MANQENVAPARVLEMTQNYLHQLSPGELLQQFLDLSHQFSSKLDITEIDELKKLQYYLRLIAAELKMREA